MIIFIVLSDTVIWGIRKTAEYAADRLGQVVANQYRSSIYYSREKYNRLLRGEISEEEYWQATLKSLPISVKEAEGYYSRALRCAKPELLEILSSIKSHPSQIPACKGHIEYGRPEIQLLCDCPRSRQDEIKNNHPEIFKGATQAYWSFEYGHIVSDKGYLEAILQIAGIRPEQAFLIAGDPFSTTAAALVDDPYSSNGIPSFGIPNALYVRPESLKKRLLNYGFEFY